jgi:hypothetical protein
VVAANDKRGEGDVWNWRGSKLMEPGTLKKRKKKLKMKMKVEASNRKQSSGSINM